MADGSVDLAIRIPVDTSQLTAGVEAVKRFAAAERDTAEAAKKLAADQRAAADATRFLEGVAARGSEVEKLALAFRRLNEEIRASVKAGGDATLAQRAQAAASKEFAANLAALHAPVEKVGAAAAKTSANATGLIRQLNDVGVMASMGASPLQILATQGEQLAFAFQEAVGAAGILSTSMGTGLVIAGSVAAAVGLVYLAYQGYTDEAKQAEIQTAILNRGMEAMRPILEETRLALIDVAEATGNLTEAQADMERVSVRAFTQLQRVTDEARKSIRTLQADQASVTTQITDSVEGAGRAIFGAYAPGVMILDALTTNSEEYQGQIDANNQTIKQAQDATRGLVATQQLAVQADADEKASKATLKGAHDAETAARKAATEEARRQAEAQRAWADWTRAQARAEDILTAAIRGGMSERERAYVEHQDRVRAILDAAEALGDEAAAQAALTAEGKRWQEQLNGIRDAEERSRMVSQGQTARDALSAAATGATSAASGPSGVMGAVAQAGPWGAIIAAIVGALENGLADLGDTFNDFTMNFNNAVGSLGDTLGDNLGRWLETGTETAIKMVPDLISGIAENIGPIFEGLIDGLAEAIPAIIRALIIDLPSAINSIIPSLISAIFDGEMWQQAGKSLVEGFIQSFTSFEGANGKTDVWSVLDKVFLGGAVNMIGGAFSGKAGGGYVSESGLYPLHKGEEVYNRSRVQSEAQQPRGMGGRGRMVGSGGRAYIEIDIESLSSTLTDAGRRGLTFGAS